MQRHNDFFSPLFLAFPSKLRNQAQSERYGYKEVISLRFVLRPLPPPPLLAQLEMAGGGGGKGEGGKMKLVCSPLVPREGEGLPPWTGLGVPFLS